MNAVPKVDRKQKPKRVDELLRRNEGLDVDFKRDLRGLHPEDLVAFANTPHGGAILLGVSEATDERGRQVAKVTGCPVGDAEKLQIVNKAQECIPPIHVEVFPEEVKGVTFLRVEIPASVTRPHSTSAGAYKIRTDGRNRPLRPDEISTILLERESAAFRERFTEATATLARTLERLVAEVGGIEANLEAQLQGISSSADHAGSEASDAAWTLRSLEDSVTALQRSMRTTERSLGHAHERLAYMMEATKVHDPVAEREKLALREEIAKFLRENPDMLKDFAAQLAGTFTVQITSPHAAKLTRDQIREVTRAAITAAVDENAKEPSSSQTPKKTRKGGRAKRKR
jgi:hypothetical protein